MHHAGLGTACDIARQEMGRDQQHIKRLSERLYNGITQQLQVRFGVAGTREVVFRYFTIAAEGTAVLRHHAAAGGACWLCGWAQLGWVGWAALPGAGGWASGCGGVLRQRPAGCDP